MQVLSPALSIAAGMCIRSPFTTPFGEQDEADRARRQLLAGPGAAWEGGGGWRRAILGHLFGDT